MNPEPLRVFYDGACPLCRAEIGHYRKLEGAQNVAFHDVSKDACALPTGLSRAQALARFHVQRSDGSLASGAEGFATLWAALPRWRWAARMARWPGVMNLLESGYRIALRVRPRVANWLNKRQSRRADPPTSAD